MLQGECINCGRRSWLIDYMCPKCIRKKEEKELLTQGKIFKGGVNEKPKGERPPEPPKQGKIDLDKLSNMTVIQLAQLLEDGLLNGCWLDENMSVLEFITYYLN